MAYEVEQTRDALERLALSTGGRWAAEHPLTGPSPDLHVPPRQQPTQQLQSIFFQGHERGTLSDSAGFSLGSDCVGGAEVTPQRADGDGMGESTTARLTSQQHSFSRDSAPSDPRPNPASSQMRNPAEMQFYGFCPASGAMPCLPTSDALLGGGGPSASSLFVGSLLGGRECADWEHLRGGAGQQAQQLDFDGFLGPLTAVANTELGPLPGGESRGVEAWGPRASSNSGHNTARGLSNRLPGSAGLGDWRIPGSVHQAMPYLTFSQVPPQAQDMSLDPQMMFTDKMYLRNGPDLGQPSLPHDGWHGSNGNTINGLDALSGDPTFWGGSTAGPQQLPRSQVSTMHQTQRPYSHGRASPQSASPPHNQGQSQQNQYTAQYAQVNQSNGPPQQQRLQRGKREHRRSSGGGGAGRGGGGRSYGQTGRGSSRRSNPVAAPPSWADANWHPRRAVAAGKVGHATGGTGVFLPGTQKAAVAQPGSITPPLTENTEGKPRGNAEYMRPQSRERVGLPEEWVY